MWPSGSARSSAAPRPTPPAAAATRTWPPGTWAAASPRSSATAGWTSLQDVLDEAGLPSDPEFRAVFVHYIEWGTRMAVLYSGENPPPVDAADVPVRDRGRTPPWQPEG